MVTKLKNIKYSTFAKVTAIILAWLSIISLIMSFLYLDLNQNVVFSENYFDSYKFISEYSRSVHNVVEYYVVLKSEENIKLTSTYQHEIENKMARYDIIRNRLPQLKNFAYYIKNKNTGEIFTNIDSDRYKDIFNKQKTTVQFVNNTLNYSGNLLYTDDLQEMLKDNSYEVYAAVIEPLQIGDVYYDNYISFLKIKSITKYCFTVLIASIVTFLLMMAYLFYSAGHKANAEKIALTLIDRVYMEIHSLAVLIAAIISLYFLYETVYYVENMTIFYISIGFILSIDFFIGLSYVLSITRQIKAKTFRSNFLVYKVYSKTRVYIKLCLNGKVFKPWILILLPLYVIINIVLTGAMVHYFEQWSWYLSEGYYGSHTGFIFFISLGLFLAINIFVFYITAKSLRDLPQIMEAAKQMAGGNLDYKLDIENMSVTFSSFAENIQSIQIGLKKAVEDAIKGERMKTDLITNVSHDLKTPLTSIINYVDLLKKESIENKKAKEYIEVLDEKSARLKVLIEDLIEASKASSGNLPVNTEKLDMCELVMQAIGEYREKFESRGLDVRLINTEKNIFVQADGKHMWRIIENLLSNILKYSMKKSRVYINIARNEAYGVLTFKNISELPLEIPVDQLTERFVRGDISRTTEGSGLGLSIAQSLANIQKGNFHIEIDGDLFKATVEIPLWS